MIADTSVSLTATLGDAVVYDLSRPLQVGMPQSPNHPAYWHAMPRRHGDMVRADGGSAANDMISMGTHVGTHVDALAHVSQDGLLHGGVSASEVQVGGRFLNHGVHTIAPMVGRGVLLDVPRALGREVLEPGYEITVADIEATVEVQQVTLEAGDVVLVRSGWGARWEDSDAYVGRSSGVPGVGEEAATWLAGHAPLALGADTIAFERLAPGQGHATLPAHRVLLVEHGIYIIETMDLEELARAGAHEFGFVCAPLRMVGATGSPVRPLAIVST